MNLTFATPVDASKYSAGFGVAIGAQLHSINYSSGEIVFSLIAQGGAVSSKVNGIVSESPDQETAAAEIRAVIAGA